MINSIVHHNVTFDIILELYWTFAGESDKALMDISLAGRPVKLKRQLGLLNGIAIVFSLIVGSGIYLTPTGVIAQAGSTALCLLLWGVAGVLEMMGILCIAELGTTFPQSGERWVKLQSKLVLYLIQETQCLYQNLHHI